MRPTDGTSGPLWLWMFPDCGRLKIWNFYKHFLCRDEGRIRTVQDLSLVMLFFSSSQPWKWVGGSEKVVFGREVTSWVCFCQWMVLALLRVMAVALSAWKGALRVLPSHYLHLKDSTWSWDVGAVTGFVCTKASERFWVLNPPQWWLVWHSCVSDSLLQPFVFTQIIPWLLDISVKSLRHVTWPWPCSSVQGKDDEQSSLLKTQSSNGSFNFCKEMKNWKKHKLLKTTGGWISNFLG